MKNYFTYLNRKNVLKTAEFESDNNYHLFNLDFDAIIQDIYIKGVKQKIFGSPFSLEVESIINASFYDTNYISDTHFVLGGVYEVPINCFQPFDLLVRRFPNQLLNEYNPYGFKITFDGGFQIFEQVFDYESLQIEDLENYNFNGLGFVVTETGFIFGSISVNYNSFLSFVADVDYLVINPITNDFYIKFKYNPMRSYEFPQMNAFNLCQLDFKNFCISTQMVRLR